MTDGAKKVLAYFKSHFGEEITKQKAAADLGVSVATVTGTVNSQIKKGHMTERVEEVTSEDGKKTAVKYVTLTPAGFDFDPEVAEAEEKAAKEAAKAAKAAAKAAAKDAE